MLNWGVVKITWGSVVVFCKKILEMGGGGNNVQWDGVGGMVWCWWINYLFILDYL